jgi:phage gpG-like protein
VHQFGGVVGKGSHIPARTFLWASDRLQDTFENALTEHLMDGWNA